MTTPAETIRAALQRATDAPATLLGAALRDAIADECRQASRGLTLLEAEVERLKKAPMKAHVVEVGVLYGLLGVCDGVLPRSHEDPERALGIIRDEVAKCKQALAQPGDAA